MDLERRQRWHRVVGAGMALGGLAIAACILPDVELDGRPCRTDSPCVTGYTCVSEGDAGVCRDPNGTLSLSNFRSAWQTPHQIELEWNIAGPPNQSLLDVALKYELHVRKRGSATEELIEATTNRELGKLVTTQNDTKDFVTLTIVYDREPEATYDLSLVAFPKFGEPAAIGPITVTTPPAKARTACEVVVDHGTVRAKSARPYANAETGAPAAVKSDAGIVWDSPKLLWENVGVGEGVQSDASLDRGIATAPGYVEVTIPAGPPSNYDSYTGILIGLGKTCSKDCNFQIERWVLRRTETRTYEFPLPAFRNKAGGSLPASFSASAIDEIYVGTSWWPGRVVVESIFLCAR